MLNCLENCKITQCIIAEKSFFTFLLIPGIVFKETFAYWNSNRVLERRCFFWEKESHFKIETLYSKGKIHQTKMDSNSGKIVHSYNNCIFVSFIY